MSGRIADPVSLFTRYVPPVVEEKPEEEEVAQATVAPVAPVYYQRPQPVDQGGGDYMSPQSQPTGSGNFFTDLKGFVSPITDLFTTTSPMDAYAAQVAGADFGPTEAGLGANYAPVSQGAPISSVEVSDFPAPAGSQPNPAPIDPVAAAALQEEIARGDRDLFASNVSPQDFVTYEAGFDPSYSQYDLTSFYETGETPVNAAVTAIQTGQEVDPATVGVTDPVTGVTTYGDQFMTAPAPDPYEASMLSGVKGLLGYPDDRTYADGRFNALGEDTTREGYEQDDKMRGLFSQAFAYGAPMIGGLMGGMTAGTRLGAEEGPYGRDGAGNYRFNAAGPMGTLQSPYGVLNTGPAYGNVATNDYSGLYGLGTLYNTGRSQTPMMFDGNMHKGGAHGYGLGFKTDGSFGSLDEFDVLDYAGMYENARDFSYGDGDQGLDNSYDYDAGTEDWGGPDDDGGWDYF